MYSSLDSITFGMIWIPAIPLYSSTEYICNASNPESFTVYKPFSVF